QGNQGQQNQGQGQNQGRQGQRGNRTENPGRGNPSGGNSAPGEGETRANLNVPPGHFPREGQCRIWIPGTPPGNQAAPRNCRGIEASAPAGAMILRRAAGEESRALVRVQFVNAEQAGTVDIIRYYDAATLEFVSEEQPPQRGRGRSNR
ncbi:MAG: hypothetical protein OEZ54_04290, partial [Gemmatimonadota bacterium]|nr:hypothetical protein [Gemmatimonadota bacterium]